MVPEKQERYWELIRRVRESYADHPGGLSWYDDCKEINLWTYWQGRDCGKVRILLVGQDWGAIANEENRAVIENVRRINSGKKQSYMEHNHNPTDRNLIELFHAIGYDICSDQSPNAELFFTNFILGYRQKVSSRNCRDEWIAHDAPFFKELVELLEPDFVFCLGQQTFLGALLALEVERPHMGTYNAFIRSESNPIRVTLPNGVMTKICALAHCGKLGTLNRNRKSNELDKNSSDFCLDNQIQDWKWVIRDDRLQAYHKLVRDYIPEIIEADGKTCVTETLSDKAYLQMLDEKLNEELAEYQESKSLEELADLLEVMQAVVKARGWTLEQLEQVRADKAAKRGGFEKKILLKEVKEQ